MRTPAVLEAYAARALLGLPTPVLRRLAGRPITIDGNTLAAETQLMLRLKDLAGVRPTEALPVPEGRLEMTRSAGLISRGQKIGAVRDLTVSGADGDLPARLYTPTERLGQALVPTLLFLHGGGFVYGDLDSHDGAARHLAEKSGVQVLAVEYRLAPENPFPAGYEDAFAALRWLLEHGEEVNADPTRLGVGGDSAGGNLAAAVALEAAEQGIPLAFQLLVYPVTRFGVRSRSRELFEEGFYLTAPFMDQVDEMYLPNRADMEHPRASVLLAKIPDGLAPALVVTAGFDPLRDDGRAYAARLEEAGVRVEHVEFPDVVHSFFNQVSAGRVAPAYNREIAARLRRALG